MLVGSDQKSEVKWPTQSDFLTIFTTIAYQNKLAELITCISLVFPYDIGVAQNRPKRDPKSAKKKSQLFFPWSDFNISGLKRTARSWTITCQKNWTDPITLAREISKKAILTVSLQKKNSHMGEKKLMSILRLLAHSTQNHKGNKSLHRVE